MKIGTLARRVGITVRTLHHYHRIGLVVPTARTGSGHRLYAARDIERLARVLLLKQLGLPLDQIAHTLSARKSSACDLISQHLAQLRARIQREQSLCQRLQDLLNILQKTKRASVEDFLNLMEMMTMIENYYTPEQLDQLKKRREALGDDAIKAVENEWPQLIEKVKTEMLAGTPVTDPKVQALARRWKELVESFTGGDPGISKSLGKLWKEKGPEMAGKMNRGFDPQVFQYAAEAQKALQG
jgi:DNA-binding transcriptional MerR regulator